MKISKVISISNNDSLDFSKFVGFSVFFHFLIVAVFIIKPLFGNPDELLIQNAIRVDMVALPDKATEMPTEVAPESVSAEALADSPPTTLPEIKKEEVKPLEIKKPKIEEKAVNLEAKKKQQDAINKLKQLSAMEKLKELDKKSATSANTLPKGNTQAKGNALTGVDQLQSETYLNRVDQHIRGHIEIPQYLKKRSLRTQIMFKVDSQGFISESVLLRPSGNAVFDDLILLAVKKSSPIPKPPERLAEYFSEKGLVIEFTSD